MTMPQGSAEEPDVIITQLPTVAVHVVSSDAKPGKSIAPEFAFWRTFVIGSGIGPYASTPGAVQIANRSLRRHRLHIFVQPTIVAQTVTDGVIVGSQAQITSGQPANIGSLGGFLPIGTSLRWESQQALWACFPVSNGAAVFVTVCDETYGSDAESWKHD